MPGVLPATVAVKIPLLLVCPLGGVRVTEPVPVDVRLTSVLVSGAPEAFFNVTVNAVVGPPTTKLDEPAETEMAAPETTIGICWVMLPTDAVTITVRLVGSAEPAVKVTLAVPSVPAITDPAESAPESALKLMVALDTAALSASRAVAVNVVKSVPSDFTFNGFAVKRIDATGFAVPGVDGLDVLPPPPPPPPQPATSSIAVAQAIPSAFLRLIIFII